MALFAAPGSTSSAAVYAPLEAPHPDEIGSALYEADYVGAVFDAIELADSEGRSFDVIHDHSGFTAVAMAKRVSAPIVHTLHQPFNAGTRAFYARHGHKARLVALSRCQLSHAPAEAGVVDVIPNPIRVADWPFVEAHDDYLLWIGRMDPVKGAHRAIDVARRAGRRLLLAGPIQPGQESYFHGEVEPHLDGDAVTYVGEVAGAYRKELFARAAAFLMPIRWAEPFGMVMVEALACGTPVIAFPEGAAAEIVIDGHNGFHVVDEREMTAAIGTLDTIDPDNCRDSVDSRYDAAIVADRYEQAYLSAARPALARDRYVGELRPDPRADLDGPAGPAGQRAGSRRSPDRVIATSPRRRR